MDNPDFKLSKQKNNIKLNDDKSNEDINYYNTILKKNIALTQLNEQLEYKYSKKKELQNNTEKEYKTLIEKVNDAVIEIDNQGIIHIWNQHAKKIFNYTQAEIIGKKINVIIPDNSRNKQKLKNIFQLLLQSTTKNFIEEFFELEGLRKDGTIISVGFNIFNKKIFNNNIFFMILIEDTTQKKRMEKHLMQSEKLQSIGHLAAGVAHEINNPLSIMEMDLTLMLESIKGKNTIKENIYSLKYQLERIAGIVRGLQDISRPVSSPKELIDINKLFIGHMLHIAFKELEKNNISVLFDLKEPKGIVKASKSQLIQVFLNVIKNAEDAMMEKVAKVKKEKQKIKKIKNILTISTKVIKKNSTILIIFFDTGIGIKKEHLSNIFNPFFTTKGFNGTGLGLPICYNIIKSFGGDIRVDSTYSEGTSFQISLPLVGSV